MPTEGNSTGYIEVGLEKPTIGPKQWAGVLDWSGNIPENSGLEGLKKALSFRLYSRLNLQSISEDTENSFVFKMNRCRVQFSRNRKGLPDFPCKSVGIVEYSGFAKVIDSRIKTTCIACPPDEHPQEFYCAWKFEI